MQGEMDSLRDHDIWELVNLPPGKRTVGSKWVYKVKTNSDGSIGRYKARLVAQGYNQKFGADNDETFCSVVRPESLRVLVAMSVQQGLELHHSMEPSRRYMRQLKGRESRTKSASSRKVSMD